VPGTPAEVATRVTHALRPRPGLLGAIGGYRVRVDERGEGLAIAAERGHVRELGNLIFHLSLVAILLAVASGSLLTYRGQAVIVEGGTFTNAVADYDTYESGRLFDPARLEPFTITLDRLDSAFFDD